MSKLDLCERLQAIRDSLEEVTNIVEELNSRWEDYEVLSWGFGERPAVYIMIRQIREYIDKLNKFLKEKDARENYF